MAEAPRCAVFWGSHGCDLPRGHADEATRHQCGLEGDEDGTCSQVTWELDPLLGIERWVWRFANAEGDGWDPGPFPATLFGDDVPEGTGGSWDEEQRVRQAWQDAGKLAFYRAGQGWVYEVKGESA